MTKTNATSAPSPLLDPAGKCADCGADIHYDYGIEDYAHVDPSTPACFLIP